MKLAWWRSPLRSSGGSGGDHIAEMEAGSKFGPLDLGPITIGLGKEGDETGREGQWA